MRVTLVRHIGKIIEQDSLPYEDLKEFVDLAFEPPYDPRNEHGDGLIISELAKRHPAEARRLVVHDLDSNPYGGSRSVVIGPPTVVEMAVSKRVGAPLGADRLGALQIGDRAGDLEHPIVAACGEAERAPINIHPTREVLSWAPTIAERRSLPPTVGRRSTALHGVHNNEVAARIGVEQNPQLPTRRRKADDWFLRC